MYLLHVAGLHRSRDLSARPRVESNYYNAVSSKNLPRVSTFRFDPSILADGVLDRLFFSP